MFHKKTLITLVVLGLILSAGIASSYAFGGKFWGHRANLTDEQKEEFQAKKAEFKEQQEALNTALENKDYDTWLSLIAAKEESIASGSFAGKFEGKNFFEAIDNQEDFLKLAEAHAAALAGDYETAKALHEELGLPEKHDSKMGSFRKGAFMKDHKLFDKNGDGVCDYKDLE